MCPLPPLNEPKITFMNVISLSNTFIAFCSGEVSLLKSNNHPVDDWVLTLTYITLYLDRVFLIEMGQKGDFGQIKMHCHLPVHSKISLINYETWGSF